MTDAIVAAPHWPRRAWQSSVAWTRAFASHPDPLVEASNWVAILLGTHLPFWPLYVWASAGAQAFPTALLTMTFTPVFLVIPPIARRSGLAGRVAVMVAGIANTVFLIWVLGPNSGTVVFLAPCAVFAAIVFRRHERWWMLAFVALPLAVFYVLPHVPLVPLHRYDAAAAKQLVALNIISVTVLIAAFGWLQADVYRRMEKARTASGP